MFKTLTLFLLISLSCALSRAETVQVDIAEQIEGATKYELQRRVAGSTDVIRLQITDTAQLSLVVDLAPGEWEFRFVCIAAAPDGTEYYGPFTGWGTLSVTLEQSLEPPEITVQQIFNNVVPDCVAPDCEVVQ